MLVSSLRQPAPSPPARPGLPTFESHLPTVEIGAAGLRPMDAAEQARRREGITSFAVMGQAEEAKLRAEQAGESPREGGRE